MAKMAVKYVGLSMYRALTEDDLRIKGVEPLDVELPGSQEWMIRQDAMVGHLNPKRDLIWGPFNGYTMIMDVDPALEEMLRREGHFTLTADTGETVAEATDPTHPGDVVEAQDGDTPAQRNRVIRK
jgi:hypothetical protein